MRKMENTDFLVRWNKDENIEDFDCFKCSVY